MAEVDGFLTYAVRRHVDVFWYEASRTAFTGIYSTWVKRLGIIIKARAERENIYM
jgi:hypothetical protein